MAWSSQNSSLTWHPKEKYCTHRAQVRCHMKRRGYWDEGYPRHLKFIFFFILLGCFKTCYCSIYQRFYACILSALLHRLKWILWNYAACVDGQKKCVANRCTSERLGLFYKCIFFVEWLHYILSSKINVSELIWLTVSKTTGRRGDYTYNNSFSITRQDLLKVAFP